MTDLTRSEYAANNMMFVSGQNVNVANRILEGVTLPTVDGFNPEEQGVNEWTRVLGPSKGKKRVVRAKRSGVIVRVVRAVLGK